jgi:hypothetical protein
MDVPEPASLTVNRHSPDDSQDRELYVSLDGGPNTILRYGESVTLPLDVGHHLLRVHNTWQWKRTEFEVAPGDQVRFAAANVPSKNFGVLATFLSFAPMHTRLEREDG